MKKHRDGEVWGLDICPKTGYIYTTADDNKILGYDPIKNICIAEGKINEVAGKR